MFTGEETAKIQFESGQEELHGLIQNCFEDLGDVSVSKNGSISIISNQKYNGTLVKTDISGSVKRSRSGDYKIVITYSSSPTITAWIIVLAGFLFCFLIGGLIALIPAYSTKNQLEKDIRRLILDI